ncbi:hypothetical protein ABMC89_09525 [Sulfitobacter sp. HNIBRBA3233]|uniref:hypothetical protein n=1 Tax=Sulfitobacter marinivivus TaxID=3158558 RepID=UPI0032DFA9CD
MRRVIFHAGFHKTGTTALQQTLRANRQALRPEIRLVLRPGMTALCESARAYSRSLSDVDLGMVKFEAAALARVLDDEMADQIFITSEDLSGHMPGRHGLRDYAAAPDLMRALAVAFGAACPEDEIAFLFTTRAADPWLRSCYVQHLRASRMVLDADDYTSRLAASADHAAIIDRIRAEVPDHKVHVAALEDHADAPLGLAEVALDLLEVSAARRARLRPAQGHRNAAPTPAQTAELLALNRSDLSQADLKAAKARVMEQDS